MGTERTVRLANMRRVGSVRPRRTDQRSCVRRRTARSDEASGREWAIGQAKAIAAILLGLLLMGVCGGIERGTIALWL